MITIVKMTMIRKIIENFKIMLPGIIIIQEPHNSFKREVIVMPKKQDNNIWIKRDISKNCKEVKKKFIKNNLIKEDMLKKIIRHRESLDTQMDHQLV